MAPNGGTFLFLLIMASAALGMPPDGNKRDVRNLAKKLMMKCQNKGYPKPEMTQLKSFFNISDSPAEDRKHEESPISMFLKVLHSGSPEKANNTQVEKMTNKMWNCSRLLAMARLMRNSSGTPACYIQAFVAPLAWKFVSTQNDNLSSDDYETLLRASRPVVVNRGTTLPSNVLNRQRLRKMMEMLREAHDEMSKDQRVRVIKWLKEQITQKYFNCTTGATSDSSSKRCKPLLKWLNSEAWTNMGPFFLQLSPNDLNSSPQEQLCDFFGSAQFKSSIKVTMKPSLGRKLVQKFRECFNGKEENVDKLGSLACYYSPPPNLTLEISRKFLAELNARDDCNSPSTLQLKKRLVQSVMSKTNATDALHNLGKGVALLSPKQLSDIPEGKLKEILRNLGPSIKWTKAQRRFLVKKLLCRHVSLRGCGTEVSTEELTVLQSVADGLPNSVFKDVKTFLKDKEVLRNMSIRMKKRQRMAMLKAFYKEKTLREAVQSLPGPLLRIVSLNNLEKANILSHTSLDQVLNKTWSRKQAIYLAKQIRNKNQRYWRLRSVLQGVTCEMIDKVPDSDVEEMVQGMTESSQWLSKMQAGCVARKLFATKYKNMTMEDMMSIPTPLLIHLPPLKVKKLSDSVCTIFLDKMEEADLSLLPYRSPSRPALTQRALLCLTTEKGTDFSGLKYEDLSRLGPLLCELKPSQLVDLAPDVVASSLQEMASCQHIPQRHRADLIQLAYQTFGNPSNWSAEMMEDLGPLILLDDDATSALPDKPGMKDILNFLMSTSGKQMSLSHALRRKLFSLTITAPKKRASDNGIQNVDEEITVERVEELRMGNVFWPAAQLARMSTETFLAALETLGAVPDYNQDQLDELVKKATEAFGPVSQMNESVVVQLGCITRGFRNADLEMLPLSLDNVDEISDCSWTESQIESVWKGIAKNQTAQQLVAEDMVALGQFICGLNTSELRQLNMDAFRDAVGLLGAVQCSPEASKELKNLAVSAFGDPSTWSDAQVSELGNIVAGLNLSELLSLDPSVFLYFSESSIPRIQNLSALPVAQLESFGPDNAAMVTSEQRSAMNEEQLDALDRAETGTWVRSERSTEPVSPSGSPSLTVEGIAAFLKPFLVLITGFLLL